MVRMGRLQIVLIAVLGFALLASVGVIFYQSRRIADVERQSRADQQSLRKIQASLRQNELGKAAVTGTSQTSESEDKAAIAQRDSTIEQLNTEISQAHDSITALEGELSNVKAENQQALSNADELSKKLQAKWQNRLDALQLELGSTQADLQDARQRNTALEATNVKLQDEKISSSAQGNEREKLLASLQDLNRRREAYLTSIADRYRDLTGRFRTMSGMLESNRNNNSAAFSGAALDLIQNAISLSESDFHHLAELDAKAFLIEKKLQKQ